MNALLVTGLTVGLMDAMWLTYRYKYHNDLFFSVQKSKLNVRVIPAILIYILIPLAVIWAIKDKKTFEDAILSGAIMGFFLYGLYDLTNYATLSGWTLEMVLTDILWGTTVCTIGAAAAFYFKSK